MIGSASTLDRIAREHGLELILQFGSTVRSSEHEHSDRDIAVLGHGHLAFEAQIALIAALQAALPGREIDLVVLDHADPLLLKQVTDACRLLWGSPRRLAELRMLAFRRYQDHRRFLEMERAYVRRFLDERR